LDNIILDLGFDVNMLPKKTRELMGKPKLVWSHVLLKLVNQHKIVLIRWLIGVIVNIDGVRSMAEFEFIEIMDEIQPYTPLLY
jgi:hypothetical protein